MLQVRRTLSEPRGGYTFEAPKSGKGRNIRLTQRATALREHRQRQLEERIECGALWQDHGLVFPSGVGTPLVGGNLHRAFKELLKRAGLPEMRFHDLRHTTATLLSGRASTLSSSRNCWGMPS
jgi:integrase